MAQYNGLVSIPHSTYEEWKTATLGNGYDADGSFGNQCWDYVAEFWYNVGFTERAPSGRMYPETGGDNARGIWNNRTLNAGDKFDLVNTLFELKVGDIICFGNSPYGHVGFVDHEYDGSGRIWILSQNNDLPLVTVETFGVGSFQGAFRYKEWHTQPRPTTRRRSNFPWVLYARKLRGIR